MLGSSSMEWKAHPLVLNDDGTVRWQEQSVGGSWRVTREGLAVTFHCKGVAKYAREVSFTRAGPDVLFGHQAMKGGVEMIILHIVSAAFPQLKLTATPSWSTGRHSGRWRTPGWATPIVLVEGPNSVEFGGRCVGGRWGWIGRALAVQFSWKGGWWESRLLFELAPDGRTLQKAVQLKTLVPAKFDGKGLPQLATYKAGQTVELVFDGGLPPENVYFVDMISSY